MLKYKRLHLQEKVEADISTHDCFDRIASSLGKLSEWVFLLLELVDHINYFNRVLFNRVETHVKVGDVSQ